MADVSIIEAVGHIEGDRIEAVGEIGNAVYVYDVTPDVYTGETTVDPNFDGTTLGTAHKLVTNDITVRPIQVESVTNLSGGRTVYIGGII